MRWTLIACVAIVAFDAVTAVGADIFDYSYGGWPGIIGSTAIYAFPAVMVVRDGMGLRHAALAGGTVGLVDATLGWAVAWVIGPGMPPPDSRGLGLLAVTAVTVVAIGVITGLAAGFVTQRWTTRRTPS